MKPYDHNVTSLSQQRVACKDCGLFELCIPVGIQPGELELLDRIIKRRKPLKRGEHIFHLGSSFNGICAIRSGSVKTYVPTEDGLEQVTGFHLPGELLGLEAINSGQHGCSAKVLETTNLCEIPYSALAELGERIPSLQQQLLTVMSKELLHDQQIMLLLGKKSAEERLAAMLLNLSIRYQQREFSPVDFHLSMSRNDIANYLGLAVETVSRLFSRFQDEKLLSVQRKHIKILDLEGLRTLSCSHKGSEGKVGRSAG